MTDLIKIEGHDVNRIEYKGRPIITFKMVDELHGRPEGTARVTFNRNKERFIQDEHYFDVPYLEWSQLSAVCLRYGGSKQHNSMKFFTEAGYLLLVKPFNDDRAWKVQDSLIRDYFRMKASIQGSIPMDPFKLAQERALSVIELCVKAGELLGTSREMARAVAVESAHKQTGVDLHSLLIHNTVPEKLLTPTELARRCGVSVRILNTRLEQAGFQTKPEKVWEATEKGRAFSSFDPYQSQHSNHTGYRLVWKPSVLDHLEGR